MSATSSSDTGSPVAARLATSMNDRPVSTGTPKAVHSARVNTSKGTCAGCGAAQSSKVVTYFSRRDRCRIVLRPAEGTFVLWSSTPTTSHAGSDGNGEHSPGRRHRNQDTAHRTRRRGGFDGVP